MLRRVLAVLPVLLAAVAIAAAPPAAGGVETNEWFSFSGQVIACDGELITVEVDVHLLSRVSTDAQGVQHLGSTITTFFRATSESGAQYVGQSSSTTELRGDVYA